MYNGYEIAFALWIAAIGLFIVAAPMVEIRKANKEMALREKELELRRKELEQRNEVRQESAPASRAYRRKKVQPSFVDTDSPEYRRRYYQNQNYVN